MDVEQFISLFNTKLGVFPSGPSYKRVVFYSIENENMSCNTFGIQLEEEFGLIVSIRAFVDESWPFSGNKITQIKIPWIKKYWNGSIFDLRGCVIPSFALKVDHHNLPIIIYTKSPMVDIRLEIEYLSVNESIREMAKLILREL